MTVRAILGVFLAFGFGFGSAETVTFDGARPGFIPPGWSVTSTSAVKAARWQVQTDKTAPSRPNVFAQLSTRSGKQDYTVALFDKNPCKDGDLSVDMKLVSGKFEQSGGVVWRFQDTANFYFALASADKDSVGIYKKMNNQVSLLANASVPHQIDDKEWNLLKVVFRGPHFTLFFGHRKLIDTQDAEIPKTGKTGIWTKADTVAYFDNFRIDKKN
jgi:hypothetical protein